MTFDEAVEAIKARAPIEHWRANAPTTTAGVEEEIAYQLVKWARKNATE